MANSSKLRVGLLIGLIISILGFTAASLGAGAAYIGLKDANEQLEQVRGEKEQLAQEYQQLSQQQDQLSLRHQEQEDTILSLEKETSSLEDQLKDAQETIRQLQEQLAILQEQVEPYQPASSVTEDGQVVLRLRKPSVLPDAKLIALTFDDGPSAYTAPLLDELKARGIPATFFVVGRNAAEHTDLLKRMIDEGHVVGNHTMNHQNLTNATPETIVAEITGCASVIEQATGVRPYLFRPPGGHTNEALQSFLKEQAVLSINWSVDTRDWESKDKTKILETAFQTGRYGIQDGAIVLMHDVYQSTLDAAVEMMDRLIAEGYTFVTVPDLLAARQELVTAGITYYHGFPK